jgi:acetyl-CoA carboxylase biotin carboxyl carrier protein
MMDFDELKQILEIIREHQLSEFELERDGFKIRIKKDGVIPSVEVTAPPGFAASPPARVVTTRTSSATDTTTGPPPGSGESDDEVELAVVKSPIVGTFYRSPEPEAAPFAQVGDRVRKGQVLCIIEAMKLMNEINSDYDGEITNVYVENAQPVQYGERLFAIRVG